MRSISSARAVSIKIGMCRVAGSLLRSLQTSRPAILGNIRSRMMKSGFSARALARPAAPSLAVEIANPPALRKFNVSRSTTSFSSSTMKMRLLDTASMRASCFEDPLLRFGRWVHAGLLVQKRGEFLQIGNDLGRFGQDRAGQLFPVIGAPLRHFRERHHHSQRVIDTVFDLAEFFLQLDQFFMREGSIWFVHKSGFSLEKARGCA